MSDQHEKPNKDEGTFMQSLISNSSVDSGKKQLSHRFFAQLCAVVVAIFDSDQHKKSVKKTICRA
jgi:hypothetical protein